MANLLSRITGRAPARANETVTGLSITDWAKMFRPGQQFSYGGVTQQSYSLQGGGSNGGIYAANSVVFACESTRLKVFSESRVAYQQLRNGRTGNLFSTPDLAIFEEPWPGASARDLLNQAELDAATRGNSYWIIDPDTEATGNWFLRIDPTDMKILTSASVDPISNQIVGEQFLGYVTWADHDKTKLTYYTPDQVAHFKPTPDPNNQFIGMSWMNPCLPDVNADEAITRHEMSALQNGAELGYVVTLPAEVEHEAFEEFVASFRQDHEGPQSAGKTLFLGGGADVKTVGQSFVDLALKATQGAGETRIAACAGTHPVVVGLSEGMQGSSLNAGNYAAAKRNFVDGTMRPNWGAFAGAFACLVPRLSGARLWYDDRDIPYLRADILDQVQITGADANTIKTLCDAGFDPDASIQAVVSGDLGSLVGTHTGLFSVQLQAPGTEKDPAGTPDVDTTPTGE
jgi:hypothetical protein